MAIERMKMMNVVFPKRDVRRVLEELIHSFRVEIIDSEKTIAETSFLISTSLENAKALHELNDVTPLELETKEVLYDEYLSTLLSGTKEQPQIDRKAPFDEERILALLQSVKQVNSNLEEKRKELEALASYEVLSEAGIQLPLKDLFNMEYMEVKIGLLDNASYQRLKVNAENISPIFLRVGSIGQKRLCIFSYPKSMEVETKRILLSTQFEELPFESSLWDISIDEIKPRIESIKRQIEVLEMEKGDLIHANKRDIDALYTKAAFERQLQNSLHFISEGDELAYLSMWVPKVDVKAISNRLKEITEPTIGSLGTLEAGEIDELPTSLKNNFFFKPFEKLVLLYGVPNYHELDPTKLFAICYMLLFGAMFGDLGQGLLFVIVGFFLKGKLKDAGGLAKRLGASSMVFGFFYDSFFGFEGVISGIVKKPIFIHPFEETNLVLSASVLVGLFLLTVSYFYGFANKYRMGDRGELYFGKTGIAGFFLFVAILLKAAGAANLLKVPSWISTTMMLVCILFLILKEPLWNKIRGEKKILHQSVGEFITEQFFELIETIMSIVSNSLSFVRVGAFALSHVGLFLAFRTMADMIGGPTGTVIMSIIGNIVVIVMEGMVVFIQCLRLLFYELFSKYFVGEGRLFKRFDLEEK
ncbi:V-type ATP synthase subunit I [Guggenheimella bovis]